ncbi:MULTISPECIES: aminotransferase class I/II-fold pyridoxal phosphate-dependent enzyme [Helicobacter]|nr:MULTISPECIES: aminotransferase class I/II-fold pyridoxal phosphate-dependent enzyme [Helicobacter]
MNLESLITKYGDMLFIIDEAYYEFCGKSVAYLLPTMQNLIITRTFSKAFGLASFRIGYCLSSAQNIAALNLLRNAKNITHLSQVAAIAALKDKEYMESYVKEVVLAREFFINALDSMREFKLYPYFFEKELLLRVNECIIERLHYHQKLGHTIAIVSGGFEIYICIFAKYFGIPYVVAVSLESSEGVLSGNMAGIHTMEHRKLYKLSQTLDLSM